MIPVEQRVTRKNPCPVCGHVKYCFFHRDGSAVWCGFDSHFGNKPGVPHKGGWVHRLTDRDIPADRRAARPAPLPPRPVVNFGRHAGEWAASISIAMLEDIALQLGLNPTSLQRLGIGWVTAAELQNLNTKCRSAGCWTFPMRDGRGRIVGIRLRTPDGFKYSVDGSDGSGLFIPRGIGRGGQLLLPEGPTSTAAVLSAGFSAIGRPNARAGTHHLAVILKSLQPGRVVILADNDKPDLQGRRAGIEGAVQLLQWLRPEHRHIVIVSPPTGTKDPRDWLHAGATDREIHQAIEMAARRDRAAC